MVYVLPCLLFLLIPLHAMSTTPLSDWSMSGANTYLVGHSEKHDWNETGCVQDFAVSAWRGWHGFCVNRSGQVWSEWSGIKL